MRKTLFIITLLYITAIWSTSVWGGAPWGRKGIGRGRIPLPPNFPRNGKVVKVKVIVDPKYWTHLYEFYHKDVKKIEEEIERKDKEIIEAWYKISKNYEKRYKVAREEAEVTKIWEKLLDEGKWEIAKKIRKKLRKILKKGSSLYGEELEINDAFESTREYYEEYLIKKLKKVMNEENSVIKNIIKRAEEKSNNNLKVAALKKKLKGILKMLNDIRKMKQVIKCKISDLYWEKKRYFLTDEVVTEKIRMGVITFIGNQMCNTLKALMKGEKILKKEKERIVKELLYIIGE